MIDYDGNVRKLSIRQMELSAFGGWALIGAISAH